MTAGPLPPDDRPATAPHEASDDWLANLGSGLLAYYLTSLIAILGVLFGHDFLKAAPNPLAKQGDELAAFANWDGAWYVKIVDTGYEYQPDRPSNIAFFPAFPLLGKFLAA